MLFIHNVKKIKGAAHKVGDVDSTCERASNLIKQQDKLNLLQPGQDAQYESILYVPQTTTCCVDADLKSSTT